MYIVQCHKYQEMRGDIRQRRTSFLSSIEHVLVAAFYIEYNETECYHHKRIKDVFFPHCLLFSHIISFLCQQGSVGIFTMFSTIIFKTFVKFLTPAAAGACLQDADWFITFY